MWQGYCHKTFNIRINMIQVNIFTNEEVDITPQGELIRYSDSFLSWCSIEVEKISRPEIRVPWVDIDNNVFMLKFYLKCNGPKEYLDFRGMTPATYQDILENDHINAMDCCI